MLLHTCIVAFLATAASADPGTVVERELYWAAGTRTRLTQTISGLPVEGGSLVVATDPWGVETHRYGTPLPADAVLETTPTLPPERAEASAQRVATAFGQGRMWAPTSRLAAWWNGEEPRLVWAVDASSARPPRTWRVLVDAHSGAVLQSRPTSFSADGNVFPENPETSTVERRELLGLLSDAELDGEYARATTCTDWLLDDSLFGSSECLVTGPQALPDADGHYLFAPDGGAESDPFAEVQAYYHSDLVARWFDERYGFRHAEPMDVIVNFDWLNAFYGDFDGDGVADMSFGQDAETGVDFGYDSDVVYHEFGHSVVAGIAELGLLGADETGLIWAGGSLNEGTADVFSMVLTGDPLMAEHAGTAVRESGPIRDLSEDRRCPDALRGEVHADGELWGSIMWNLHEHPDVGPDVVADLVFGAASTWTADVDWPAAGVSVLDTAAEMLNAGVIDAVAHDAVVAEIDRANLIECERVVDLSDGRRPELFMTNGGLQGDFERIPLGVQFRYTVPADAVAIQFEVSTAAAAPMGWAAHARVGSQVRHEVVSMELLGLRGSYPADFDWVHEGVGTDFLELSVGPEGDLSAGDEVYFSVASRTTELVPFDFQVEPVSVAVWSIRETDEPGGSCACDGAGRMPPALLLLPVLWLMRRKRIVGYAAV